MTRLQTHDTPPWSLIAREIAVATGQSFEITALERLGGGCINKAYRIADGGHRYFVKLNEGPSAPMFEAEADGLEAIRASATVRAPHPICRGRAGNAAYIALEYVELGPSTGSSGERLGRQLAQMHRTCADLYGWWRDNTIGSTLQSNAQHGDWITFWRERRLGFQLGLARSRGFTGGLQRKGERLMDALAGFFPGYVPRPSLLHGDLWGGNAAADEQGEPVIFDPAVYFGDRETDLAMTELFGGFPPRFYAAYREAFPLDPGYAVRRTLYNLYHILNHANLFGGGYAAQAEHMMERLLSEVS